MNKKFSTLLVSVLLASAFVGTAEAKMKTIATNKAPEAGQYLVAQAFTDDASKAQYLVGQDPTVAVTLTDEAGVVTDMSAAWTLVKSEGKYYFKNAEGKYIGKVKNKKVTAVNSISDAVGFTFEEGKFKSGNAYLAVVITAGKLYVTIDAVAGDVKALTLASLTAGDVRAVEEIGSDYYLVGSETNAGVVSKYLKYNATKGAYEASDDNTGVDCMWAIEKTTLNGKVVYKFTSAKNPAYTVMFGAGAEYNKGFNLYDINFNKALAADFTATGALTSPVIFGVYETTADYLAESDLNDILGNGFELTIDTKKDKKATIEGASAFEGVLTATNGDDADNKKVFRLKTTDGKYVALDLNANWNLSSLDDKGLKFTTIKEGDLTKTDKYYTWFQIKQAAGAEETLKSISVLKAEDGDAYGVLRIATAADKNYLTVAAADNAQTAAPYLALGSMNVVDLTEFFATPSYYSITQVNKEGTKVMKVLGVASDGTAAFVNEGSVQQDMPEGQWAAKITDNGSSVSVSFVNRENGEEYDEIQSLRATSTTTTLRAATPVYEAVIGTGANAKTIYLTLVATPLASATATDGYEIWSQNDLRDEEYTLGFYSNVLGAPAYLAENHAGGHQLGLEKDVKDAASWKLTAWTGKESDELAVTDSVYVASTVSFWNPKKGIIGDWDTKTDSLKLVAYTITNVANGEPLYYSKSSDTLAYICNPTKEAARFVIKKAANGMYNLIQVEMTGDAWELSKKVYAGFSAKYGNMQITDLTDKTENDLVVIEKKAAPEYVKLNMGDTVRIFREGAEASLLFEKGEFLGMENAFEFPKMAPAMYVDTAYVDRKDNNRYQYLLAVEPDRVITSEECTVPGHPKHETNVLHARFLVNLIDSAEVVKAANKIHGTNKYINSEKFAKLGFVPGYHAKDTLVINNSVYTGTKNAKNDTILMEKADYNVAKFAFKVVDQETKAFVIETLYKQFSDQGNATGTGYLKWMNGAIVVVPTIENADVYNLKATDENPTANEAIEAAGVQVIGGQGVVTVQGAAGKVITVANILGQTIANQVAASDNVTIAAPAGIVVVAVEGEATKVVVK